MTSSEPLIQPCLKPNPWWLSVPCLHRSPIIPRTLPCADFLHVPDDSVHSISPQSSCPTSQTQPLHLAVPPRPLRSVGTSGLSAAVSAAVSLPTPLPCPRPRPPPVLLSGLAQPAPGCQAGTARFSASSSGLSPPATTVQFQRPLGRPRHVPSVTPNSMCLKGNSSPNPPTATVSTLLGSI